MLADHCGSYILVKDNILVNSGGGGIAIAGGDHIGIFNNKIYGKQRPGAGTCVVVWNYSGKAGLTCACESHEVRGNQVKWTDKDGNNNPKWSSGCGTVAGWSDNDWNANFVTFTNFSPADGVADTTPDCTINVQDEMGGLKVSTSACEYSTDGGSTWTSWTVSCTGSDGTTAVETITAMGVPLNQESYTLNKIRFSIYNMDSQKKDSAVYTMKK